MFEIGNIVFSDELDMIGIVCDIIDRKMCIRITLVSSREASHIEVTYSISAGVWRKIS